MKVQAGCVAGVCLLTSAAGVGEGRHALPVRCFKKPVHMDIIIEESVLAGLEEQLSRAVDEMSQISPRSVFSVHTISKEDGGACKNAGSILTKNETLALIESVAAAHRANATSAALTNLSGPDSDGGQSDGKSSVYCGLSAAASHYEQEEWRGLPTSSYNHGLFLITNDYPLLAEYHEPAEARGDEDDEDDEERNSGNAAIVLGGGLGLGGGLASLFGAAEEAEDFPEHFDVKNFPRTSRGYKLPSRKIVEDMIRNYPVIPYFVVTQEKDFANLPVDWWTEELNLLGLDPNLHFAWASQNTENQFYDVLLARLTAVTCARPTPATPAEPRTLYPTTTEATTTEPTTTESTMETRKPWVPIVPKPTTTEPTTTESTMETRKPWVPIVPKPTTTMTKATTTEPTTTESTMETRKPWVPIVPKPTTTEPTTTESTMETRKPWVPIVPKPTASMTKATTTETTTTESTMETRKPWVPIVPKPTASMTKATAKKQYVKRCGPKKEKKEKK